MEVLVTVVEVLVAGTPIMITSIPLRSGVTATAQVSIGTSIDQLLITTIIRPNRLKLRILTATKHALAMVTTTTGIIKLKTVVIIMATTVAGARWTVAIRFRHIHTTALMLIDQQIEVEHTTYINRITIPMITTNSVHQPTILSIPIIIVPVVAVEGT